MPPERSDAAPSATLPVSRPTRAGLGFEPLGRGTPGIRVVRVLGDRAAGEMGDVAAADRLDALGILGSGSPAASALRYDLGIGLPVEPDSLEAPVRSTSP
jgi:hypothetical protein